MDRRYRIGYFPADNNWDGRYHQLRVTSSRSNVAIQVKPGYDAVKPVDVADDRRQAIPDLVPFSAFDSFSDRSAREHREPGIGGEPRHTDRCAGAYRKTGDSAIDLHYR